MLAEREKRATPPSLYISCRNRSTVHRLDWPISIKLPSTTRRGWKKAGRRRWKHRFKEGWKNPRQSKMLDISDIGDYREYGALFIERSSGWNLKKVPRFVFFLLLLSFSSTSFFFPPSPTQRVPAFQRLAITALACKQWHVNRRLTADFQPVSKVPECAVKRNPWTVDGWGCRSHRPWPLC